MKMMFENDKSKVKRMGIMGFVAKSKVLVLVCAVILLVGVAFSACSGGNTPSGATSQAPAQQIKVDMGDFFFKPSDITISAGAVRFICTNVGATAHRFSITGNGFDATTKNVAAGSQTNLDVTIPAGTYKIFCSLDEHEARGSVGKLTVQ